MNKGLDMLIACLRVWSLYYERCIILVVNLPASFILSSIEPPPLITSIYFREKSPKQNLITLPDVKHASQEGGKSLPPDQF